MGPLVLQICFSFLLIGAEPMKNVQSYFGRHSRPPNHRRARGMSMIEVVTVVGIIAILMSILAPALSGARLAGRATLCQSNLRQMSHAAHAYANVYGAFPIALHYAKSNGSLHDVSWDWVTKFGSGEIISPGPLWQFTDHPDAVMQCPEYIGPSNTPGDPFTGYNYSVYLGGEGKFSINPGPQHVWPGVKPHVVRRPDRITMFGLGGYKDGANKYMRSPLHNEHAPEKAVQNAFTGEWNVEPFTLPLNVIFSGGQAFRYRGKTFAAQVDGSIRTSAQPEPGEQATEELLEQFLGYPRNGFLSSDGSAYDPRQ